MGAHIALASAKESYNVCCRESAKIKVNVVLLSSADYLSFSIDVEFQGPQHLGILCSLSMIMLC